MKIKLPSGTIAESTNKLVIDQWIKAGYKDLEEKPEVEPEIEPEPVLETDTPAPEKPKKTGKKTGKKAEPVEAEPEEPAEEEILRPGEA